MADAAPERVVICRVAGERFALPLSAVREVVATPPVTRLPGAPPAVRGIANVHGTLVTTLSGPALLGLLPPTAEPSEWLLVLSLYEGRVGIEVDEVEDVAAGESLRTLDVELLLRPLLARGQ